MRNAYLDAIQKKIDAMRNPPPLESGKAMCGRCGKVVKSKALMRHRKSWECERKRATYEMHRQLVDEGFLPLDPSALYYVNEAPIWYALGPEYVKALPIASSASGSKIRIGIGVRADVYMFVRTMIGLREGYGKEAIKEQLQPMLKRGIEDPEWADALQVALAVAGVDPDEVNARHTPSCWTDSTAAALRVVDDMLEQEDDEAEEAEE